MPASLFPLILVIASSVAYHLSQKTLSASGRPFGIMAAAYALAMAICLGAWALEPKPLAAGRLCSPAHWLGLWPVLLLGLAVAGIEIGVFFAYRSGMRVSAAPVLINGAALLCLLPLDAALFKNGLSFPTLAGAALILAGMFVMQLR